MSTTSAHYIRGCGLTVGVLVDNRTGLVIDAPAIVGNFVGLPFSRRLKWMERFEAVEGDTRKDGAA
jgi:hypothetical protein